MLRYRPLIALALSVGFLHCHPSALQGQEVTPEVGPLPSELLPYAIAGAEAANGVPVTEFTVISAISAIPIGFAAPVALLASSPGNGWGQVALVGLGLSALGYAFATFSNTDPQQFGTALSIDLPMDARNAHDDAFKQRLHERRQSAAIRGAAIGSAIGLGSLFAMGAVLVAAYR